MGATWSNSNNINSTSQERVMDKKLQKVFQDLYGFDKNKDIGDQQALLDLYKEYKLLKKSNQQLEKMHHKLFQKYSAYEKSKGIFSSEIPITTVQQQKQMIKQADDVVKGVKQAIERGQQIPVSQVNDTVHNLTTIAQQAKQQAKQAKQQGNVTQAQNAEKRAQQAIKIAKTLQGVVQA
jgi:hypothetical protein